MTVDEYRREKIREITTTRDQGQAQRLVSKADTDLKGAGYNRSDRQEFLRRLSSDLDTAANAAGKQAHTLIERQAAAALSQVIAAAQAAIAQHQARIAAGG